MRILREFSCSVQVEKWKGLLERLRYSTTSNSIGDRSRDSFRLAIVGKKAFSVFQYLPTFFDLLKYAIHT
jgi:hypothetical protein